MPSPAFLIGMSLLYWSPILLFSLRSVANFASANLFCTKFKKFAKFAKNLLTSFLCRNPSWNRFKVTVKQDCFSFFEGKVKKMKDFLITVTCNFFCLISAGYIFKLYLCVRELHYLSRSFTFIIFFCVTFWRIRIRIII